MRETRNPHAYQIPSNPSRLPRRKWRQHLKESLDAAAETVRRAAGMSPAVNHGSRQQARREIFDWCYADLLQRFGGERRRTLRSMARDRAHRMWQQKKPYTPEGENL